MKLVEETVRSEHASNPNKPIYLVGDSFGGCLALAVAARNPSVDLILILVNPGQFSNFQSDCFLVYYWFLFNSIIWLIFQGFLMLFSLFF